MSAIPRFSVPVTPESVGRWTLGRDDALTPPPADGSPVPLAYFVFLRMQPILGLSMHALLQRDPDRGLYGGVTYRAQRSPRVGEVLIATGEVSARREVPAARGTLVMRTLDVQYRNLSGVVVSESVRMIDLPPGPPAPPPRGPETPPAYPKIADLAPVTPTQIAWLTVETGDMNRLHLDRAYAASRLYPDVVVPGTLTAAILERELSRFLGRGLRAFDLRLLAPCFPGEAYALHAGAHADGLAFQLYAGAGLRAQGTAA